MTIEHVDWEEFQRLVWNGLARAELHRRDIPSAFDTVRAIVRDNLEVYVDRPFLDQFHVKIFARMGIISADLEHDLKQVCHWEVTCQA